MRPVDKGDKPKDYAEYKDARDDLTDRIGFYCSYCEMSLYNRPDIEHVEPRANGGEELEWDNFLISCTYCNSNKGNNNPNRNGYLWPDTHNTFMAFIYDYYSPISSNPILGSSERDLAENTINLFKLSREPGNGLRPEHKDLRWKSRLDAWRMAKDSLEDWEETPIETVAKCIARNAQANGHFSIWMSVFKDYKEIKLRLIEAFKGTSKECFDKDGNAINFYRINK